MTLKLKVFVNVRDSQERTSTFDFYAPPPADLAAGVDLPSKSDILSVINTMIADTAAGLPSNAIVYEYGCTVIEDDMTGITNGDGATAIQTVCKTLSAKGLTGDIDRFGQGLGTSLKIPGANESGYTFSSSDKNAISTSSGTITDLRTALVAIGWIGLMSDGTPYTMTAGDTFEEASLFTGKRALMRPR